MKLSRLRGRKICMNVQKRGALWKGKTMLVRWLMGTPKHPAFNPSTPAIYIGTLASTKLDKSAVKRNRMRRRCREAFRVHVKDLQNFPTIQLLILPRTSSLTLPFADIQSDVVRFLSQVPSQFHGTRLQK